MQLIFRSTSSAKGFALLYLHLVGAWNTYEKGWGKRETLLCPFITGLLWGQAMTVRISAHPQTESTIYTAGQIIPTVPFTKGLWWDFQRSYPAPGWIFQRPACITGGLHCFSETETYLKLRARQWQSYQPTSHWLPTFASIYPCVGKSCVSVWQPSHWVMLPLINYWMATNCNMS